MWCYLTLAKEGFPDDSCLASQLRALGDEVKSVFNAMKDDNAYSAWQLRQSSGRNLQIRPISLVGHQATRVRPLCII